jgi:hypothetical protein
LDQHIPGLVDAYLGPADLKAQVDMEQLRAPSRLADDAATLRGRLAIEVPDAGRRTWLEAQLVALETQALALAGRPIAYLDHVSRCFDRRPAPPADRQYDEAAAALDRLAPGSGPLAGRLDAWDARMVLPEPRLGGLIDWLLDGFRARAAAAFGLPPGETVRVELVGSRPWTGYNWFEGALRSRVDLSTGLPIRGPDLVRTLAHETYPGHHLEHAWKELGLVVREGRMECSVQLINTPECLISEGLADVGYRFAVPPGLEVDLLAELFERAGPPLAADAAEAHALAETAAGIRPWRRQLDAARANAAILRHVEGRSRRETIDYLVSVGRFDPGRAAQRVDFIEHPLWKHYAFVYSEGEALIEAWLEQVPEAERARRFGRLLREALTPSRLAAGEA